VSAAPPGGRRRPGFVLAMAWRESRASWRRLLVLVVAEALGVGALTAVHSFSDQLQASVRRQGRELLGADLLLGSASPFTPRAEAELASLVRSEPSAESARVLRFATMAFVPGRPGARLAQVVAIEGAYPFYGSVRTDPEGRWSRVAAGEGVLVDPGLLLALGAQVGDTLALGEARLPILGQVLAFPGDVTIRSAFGPRVFLSARRAADTRLLGFGARVRHEAYVKLAGGGDPERLAGRHRAVLAEERVSLRTVQEETENVSRWLRRLARYLGLVALVALLMAGLAVASATSVLVKLRRESLAVLRCLGARSGQVMAVFLAEVAGVAALGSAAGVGLGLALESVLPRALAEWLPVDVSLGPSAPASAIGLACGIWVALVAALPALLAARQVSPLAVFRRPYESAGRLRWDAARFAVGSAIAASVAGIAIAESRDVRTGVGCAVAVGLAVGLLALAGWTTMRLMRRLLPSGWPYVWRQGIANLFRPANQTLSVALSIGFGAFLLDTLFVVERNLLGELRVAGLEGKPNVALFDIQPDQRAALASELARIGAAPAETLPVVPMRIQSVNGVAAASELGRGGRRSSGRCSGRDPQSREQQTGPEPHRGEYLMHDPLPAAATARATPSAITMPNRKICENSSPITSEIGITR